MGFVKRLEELKSSAPTEVGLLKIKPIQIHLKDNAVPYSVSTARHISVPMLSKVKIELFWSTETPQSYTSKGSCTLQTIEEAGLKLNTEKCLLRQSQLRYLGNLIDSEDICPDKSKIEAITFLEPLENITDLRRVLGMGHYLGRYVAHLSQFQGRLMNCWEGTLNGPGAQCRKMHFAKWSA